MAAILVAFVAALAARPGLRGAHPHSRSRVQRPVAAVAGAGGAVPPTSSALEEVLVHRGVTFEQKMAAVRTHFDKEPRVVASRLGEVSLAAARVGALWLANAPNRGEALRTAASRLGVVFVKLAQTLATRPDIIGDEAAEALAELQDANTPFDDGDAVRTIAEEFGCPVDRVAAARVPAAKLMAGSIEHGHVGAEVPWGHAATATSPTSAGERRDPFLFAAMSDAPIAAASLAQVYRARTLDGAAVAVKVRRPRVADNIALDCHVVRVLLNTTKRAGVLSQEADVLDMTREVGAGLFRELDFVQEAENARRFAALHAECLPHVVVPPTLPALTSRRVLTAGWVDGAKLTSLGPADQERMIRLGLDACFTQLLRTGFVHADPHYGNMLLTPDKLLALLDFGLVTSVTTAQQEAMALAILHTLARDWDALIVDLRALGLLPPKPALWVDKRTGEPASALTPGRWQEVPEAEFAAEFVRHMRAAAGVERSFSEMTVALSTLSLRYRFVLPSWMVFVIRAVVTLDGFAADLPTPISAVEEALPHALRRALTPRTYAGREALRQLCLDEGGSPLWDRMHAFASGGSGDETARTGHDTGTRHASASTGAGAKAALAGGSATNGRVAAAAREAGVLLLSPEPDGAALRRIAALVDSPRVCTTLLRGAWRTHLQMWARSAPQRREARQAVLGTLAALVATLRGVVTASRSSPGLRRRVGAAPAPERSRRATAPRGRRRLKLVALLACTHARKMTRSLRGLVAVLFLGPALVALSVEAWLLQQIDRLSPRRAIKTGSGQCQSHANPNVSRSSPSGPAAQTPSAPAFQ